MSDRGDYIVSMRDEAQGRDTALVDVRQEPLSWLMQRNCSARALSAVMAEAQVD